MNSNTYDKLSDDVFNQIKYFDFHWLTKEQNSLINELIPNEELRERYKKYGLCSECRQPNTYDEYDGLHAWCQSCNSKHFQQDFNKWTSGNKEIDEFIQNVQLNATRCEEVLEWIPYENFKDIEYITKGGFDTVYRATWIDGFIEHWNIHQNEWKRYIYEDVILKYLNNSQNLTTDFLQEVLCNLLFIIYVMYFNF
jgi:hypothetical protein